MLSSEQQYEQYYYVTKMHSAKTVIREELVGREEYEYLKDQRD